MTKNSPQISLTRKIIGSLAVIVMLWICECGDFFAEKATELQSRVILRDISKIEPVPVSGIPAFEVYKNPPKKVKQTVGGREEWKLFYFCKYHISDKLKDIVHNQFATKLFNEKGKSTSIADYTITSMLATNQLIVRCPTEEDLDAVLELLELVDIPPIQVRIDCLISEVYADETMDWETTIEIENLLGEGISLGGIPGKPAFPGAALRDAARATFGLKAGVERGSEGHKFDALVDLLVSRGYLKIFMNPTLEVVNGESAEIYTREHVPIDEITNVHPITGVLTVSTRYEDVVDSLKVIPHVFADGYIGLETIAVIGSKATPEGIKQIPIVTERKIINKENRIRQGESLVIGGITKTEKRSVVRGVPFLKDIPLLGVLFSSKDFEERGKEVLFILTPTISTGGVPNIEMVENIRKKHAKVIYDSGLREMLTDPFGIAAYTELIEQQAAQAEFDRLKSEIGKARAMEDVELLKEKLLETAEKVLAEKAKAIKAASKMRTAEGKADTKEADDENEEMKQLLKKLNKKLEEKAAQGGAIESKNAEN